VVCRHFDECVKNQETEKRRSFTGIKPANAPSICLKRKLTHLRKGGFDVIGNFVPVEKRNLG